MDSKERLYFNADLLKTYLYGYKQMRLISADDFVNTLRADHEKSGMEPPPLSPRRIRVPDEISLCSSSIPGNLFGACAVKKISHGTWFGPFEGKLVRTTESIGGASTEFMWEIFHDGEVSHYLDGHDENNWMAFVRCARHKREQNMVVFQYHGCIYYRTTRDILPGCELLVWYDNKYTQLLGLPLAWNDSRASTGKRKVGSTSESEPRKRRGKLVADEPSPTTYKSTLAPPQDYHLPSPSPAERERTTVPADHGVVKQLQSEKNKESTQFLRCEQCFLTFPTGEQLENHKCPSEKWTQSMGLLKPIDARDIRYHHSMHATISTYSVPSHLPSILQSQLQAGPFPYPSPPMDPLKQYPTAPHRGAPIAIKQF